MNPKICNVKKGKQYYGVLTGIICPFFQTSCNVMSVYSNISFSFFLSKLLEKHLKVDAYRKEEYLVVII